MGDTLVRQMIHDVFNLVITTARHLLFVIDGSKALRSAIDRVFGKGHLVQRCRNHKIKNVMDHLPDKGVTQ